MDKFISILSMSAILGLASTSFAQNAATPTAITSPTATIALNQLTPTCPPPLPGAVNWNYTGQNFSYPGRHFHSSVVMNQRLWIMGGMSANKPMADVMYTTDGLNWNIAAAQAAFGPRWGQSTVAFGEDGNRAIYLVGGSDGKSFFNDIWKSQDGINWTLVTAKAPFSPRVRHSMVVFNHKMWLIAGQNQTGMLNDVWSSADGKTWTQVQTQGTAMPVRYSASLVVYDKRMWLMAGQSTSGPLNDVWSSADGTTWLQYAVNPGFPKRASQTAVAYNGLLWVMGGHDVTTQTVFADAWWSNNGTQWTQASPSGNYTPRWAQSSEVFNNQIWMINGASGTQMAPTDFGDIWSTGCINSPTAQSLAKAEVVVGGGKTPTPTVTATVTATITSTPTSTATLGGLLQSAVAAPNVSNGGGPINFYVSLGQPGQITLTIYSLMGQQVYSTTVQGNPGQNDLLWLVRNKAREVVASGLYIYTVQVSNGSLYEKKIGKVVIVR